jgi:hypothetical protein
MGITIKAGNVVRNFTDSSSWSIVGDGEEGPEYEFGAKAWAIGKLEITIAAQPFHQIEVANTLVPNAGSLRFEGKYVPSWPRLYKIDLCSAKINAGIGVSTADSPLKFTASVSQERRGDMIGSPIYRHPAVGAPNAGGVAGDPIGFLGLGMAMSVTAGTNVGIINVSGEAMIILLRSNLHQIKEELDKGNIAAAAARSLGALFFGNHLKFFYGGALAGADDSMSIGTEFYTAGFQAGGSIYAIWASALHLYVLKPGEQEHRYVYSRHIGLNGTSNPYKNPKIKGPRWEQKWL